MTPIEIALLTEKVHTAPLPFCATGSLAIKFSHATVDGYALGDGKSVVAIRGDEQIIRTGGCHTTGSDGFLAHVGMEESTDFPFHLILLFSHQFKLTDQEHQLVPVEIGFLRKFGDHKPKICGANIGKKRPQPRPCRTGLRD